MQFRTAGLGALAIALAVVGVGCGDDDDATPAPDAGPREDGATPPPPRDMGMREDAGPRDMGMPEDAGPRDMGMPEDAGPPPEPCETRGASEELACGMCGTQTRFCTSDLSWEYGPCEGEHGVCEAGSDGELDCGAGMMIAARCTDACIWAPLDETARCALPGCDAPIELMARAGEPVSIDVDTSIGTPGSLDLGMFCGGMVPMDAERPPQVVVAFTVPGTGVHAVEFSMIHDGTDPAFDTVVQVRRGECTAIPPGTGFSNASCFDDTHDPMGGTDFRSSGAFAATGGDTVYLVITGFAYGSTPPPDRTASGRAHLELTVGDEAHPPTLRTATVSASPETSTVTVEGGDPDGDARTVRMTFLNAMGMPVDLNDDTMVDGFDDISASLDPMLMGMTSFTTMASLPDPYLAERLAAAMATRARVVLIDSLGVESAPLTVDILLVSVVGLGATCDATHVCRAPLTCTMGTCQASAAELAACMAATPIALAGSPPAGSAMGSLGEGAGLFSGTACASFLMNAEALYRVTVPAGTWDLIASNRNAGTEMTLDTLLYVRRTCADAGTEVACNDDASGPRAEATVLDAMAGDYTIFQERFGMPMPGTTTPFQLDVRLRPVLAAGAMCDPMGIANRCSTAPCPVAPAAATCPAAPTP